MLQPMTRTDQADYDKWVDTLLAEISRLKTSGDNLAALLFTRNAEINRLHAALREADEGLRAVGSISTKECLRRIATIKKGDK